MPKSNRLMLIIGIDAYQHKDFEPLPSCKKDALDLSALLSEKGFWNYEGSPFIGSTLIKEEYGWAKLRDMIFKFFNDAKPSQTLLFYFSGHGVHGKEDVILATPHVDPQNPSSKGFALSELRKCMGLSESQQIVGIIDSCYSGSADLPNSKLRKNSAKDAAKQALATFDRLWKDVPKSAGKCLLLSSQSYEPSNAVEGSNSLYTKYLLEGLKGVDDHKNEHGVIFPGSVDKYGNVTPLSLHKYLYWTLGELTSGQTPRAKIDATSEIILAYYPNLAKSAIESEASKIEPTPVEVESISWTKLKISREIKAKVKKLEEIRYFSSTLDNLLVTLIDWSELGERPISTHSKELDQEVKLTMSNLRFLRMDLREDFNYFEWDLYPKISEIKFKWPLELLKFQRGFISKKEYNNKVSFFKKKISNIYSETKKVTLPKLERIKANLEKLKSAGIDIEPTRLGLQLIERELLDYLS